jgi:hypothetical protein
LDTNADTNEVADDDGKRGTYQHHTPDVKARVLADLRLGESAAYLAEKYDVPAKTISNWRRSILAEIGLKKKAVIEDKMLEYLSANLETLRRQAHIFGEREFIESQPADKLGQLHGILADKALRLLSAFGEADNGDGATPTGTPAPDATGKK